MIRRCLPLAAIATMALMLPACGPTESDEGATEGTPPAGGATSVEVVLTEFHIDMPASIPAGSVSFDVSNSGSMTHSFEIEGSGVEEELEDELNPNQTGALEVDLEPGTYTVYCPIDDHRAQGMEVTLEVTES